MTLDAHAMQTLQQAREGLVLVLTGAGISAESGIPTFRGAEGYWKIGSRNYHPQELATAQAFGKLPREVWHWYLYRRAVCRAAEPNAGHHALAKLESAIGDRFRLVTQNVDGLHLRVGHKRERLHQIHGNIDFMRCAKRCTDTLHPMPEAIAPKGREDALLDDEYALLRCPDCGLMSRPHVLWFDEYYDEALFQAESALDAASEASLLVVVGTSGATNLPMQIGMLCARRGIPIVDVNPGENPFTEMAARVGGFSLREPAGTVLPVLCEALV